MRRDMELVRYILITVGDADGPVDMLSRLPEGITAQVMGYHVELLAAHGLIDADPPKKDMCGDYLYITVNGLTWDGEDWLESTQDHRVWTKAKEVIAKSAGSVTFQVIKDTCSLVAMGLIKSQLGV